MGTCDGNQPLRTQGGAGPQHFSRLGTKGAQTCDREGQDGEGKDGRRPATKGVQTCDREGQDGEGKDGGRPGTKGVQTCDREGQDGEGTKRAQTGVERNAHRSGR